MITGLADALLQAPSSVYPIAGSVQRALDRLTAQPAGLTQEELASVAGVTLPMLRRNVKDCTGITLSCLLSNAQLDWARELLNGNCYSRSIAELAKIAGFTNITTFVRAYQRRFGETPTQTRTRAAARG